MASDGSNYPPATISTTEGPELGRTQRSQIIARPVNSDYPLIDNDPHFTRVVRYLRPSDYAQGAAVGGFIPGAMILLQRTDPTFLPKQAVASGVRVAGFAGAAAGFLWAYSRSCSRFYGFAENRREIDMDMREMTDRVKKGVPLYGKSQLTEYMQGVAHRNTKYTGVWLAVVPWFNFVNHPYHGVDTAKYYRNAERELEAERNGGTL